MKTKSSVERMPVLREVADKLLLAHEEIDELAVQLALGKAEALDKFEEIKKDFRQRVGELKQLSGSGKPATITNIGKLEIQLELRRAGGRVAFEAQKEKIIDALKRLESKFANSESFHHEVEKFKLKLVILQLSLALKKFEIKDEFRDSMSGARKKIETIAGRARERLLKGKARYSDISDEVQLAYQHMRKAVGKL